MCMKWILMIISIIDGLNKVENKKRGLVHPQLVHHQLPATNRQMALPILNPPQVCRKELFVDCPLGAIKNLGWKNSVLVPAKSNSQEFLITWTFANLVDQSDHLIKFERPAWLHDILRGHQLTNRNVHATSLEVNRCIRLKLYSSSRCKW